MVAALLVLLVVTASVDAAHKLPSSFILCKKNDPGLDNCLKGAVQGSFKDLAVGVPSLGLPPTDPLEIPAVQSLSQGSGPVQISLTLKNAKLTGLKDCIVKSIRPHFGDKYELDAEGECEHLQMEGDYEMTGKILVLPVTGVGRCNVTFAGIKARLGPTGVPKVKSGDTYWDVTEFPFNIHAIKGMTVYFGNLFNGDKQLGDTMNQLMNENWKELWEELKPAFSQTFSSLFLKFSMQIFGKVPTKEIFLE